MIPETCPDLITFPHFMGLHPWATNAQLGVCLGVLAMCARWWNFLGNSWRQPTQLFHLQTSEKIKSDICGCVICSSKILSTENVNVRLRTVEVKDVFPAHALCTPRKDIMKTKRGLWWLEHTFSWSNSFPFSNELTWMMWSNCINKKFSKSACKT